jgi:hypothetical protein
MNTLTEHIRLLARTLETPEGRRIFIDPLRHQETIKKGPRIMRPGKGGPYERAKEKQHLQRGKDWA